MTREILLVDDDQMLLELGKESLEHFLGNTEVDTCDRGDKAVDRAKENNYDYLVTDQEMPGSLNGHEVVQRVHNFEDKPYMIMYSGKSDAQGLADDLDVPFYHKSGSEIYYDIAEEIMASADNYTDSANEFLSD